MTDRLFKHTVPQHRKVLYLILVVFGCLFFTIVIGNHYFFRTTTFDYAIYNFAFWNYAHFHINIVPCYKVFGGIKLTFLQDHFSFTLMYFVPVYWLINWLTGTYTLLLIEVVLILWSAYAIYQLIILKTNDGWLGVAAVLYYFLLQGRYSAFTADSNICTLVSCFVPLFLYYFEAKRYVVAATIFVLSLFSREDMALWFAFIFIVLIIWHWKEKHIVRTYLLYIVMCIIYFILLFKVFIPGIETPGEHYGLFNYLALGTNPWEALVFIIENPLLTIKLLFINPLPDHGFDGIKIEFYVVYLISGGFMLFYKPQYFIWFIPLIAQKMFNDAPVRWSIQSYYAITVVTMLPISVFMILSKIKTKRIRYGLATLICILTFSVTAYMMKEDRRQLSWFKTVKENIFDPDFFHPDYDAAKIHTDLKMIPPMAKICASASILPHLSQRQSAYEFPDVEDADYIAVFTFKDYYLISDDDYRKELNKFINSLDWKIVANDAPFLLLARTTGNKSQTR